MKKTLLLLLLGCAAHSSFAQQWEPYNELGDFYPSLAIATMHINAHDDDDKTSLGDPNGILGIQLHTTQPNTNITVELSCSGGIRLFDKASVTVKAPKANSDYSVTPTIPYFEDKLAGIKQTQSTYITYRVTINGKKEPDRTERLLVHPINICPFGYSDEKDNFESIDWMFAAYVNEDHPQVEKILKTALERKYVDAFLGYQGEAIDVYKQVMAVWRVLQERGIRYSDITTTVADREEVASQHVRLIDESINNTQANCVDGSVLFASILRKIGIEPILVTVPGHMFVGFDVDSEHKKQAYLETTMLGAKPGEFQVKDTPLARLLLGNPATKNTSRVDMERFVAALQTGNQTYAENKQGLDKEQDNYSKMRVSEARQLGILPIMYVSK
ncbi:hypothetical protein GCM10027578_34660 [Spirosoma luteolum]